MATTILEAQLDLCPSSEKRDAALVALEHARQIAEQFVKDFGRLEGVCDIDQTLVLINAAPSQLLSGSR